MYACIYVYMYIYIYVCIYMHIYHIQVGVSESFSDGAQNTHMYAGESE